ncbi:DUF1018 domain-containing protein [Aggregatibacter actinomycetemcomitans]|uniref:phage protein GemA/Gp16 family protein n=1 Tax=Aggregatibacter actinomycetemcomitans TaxID=714 RepID=UPI00197C848E|nr:phage protein GemA/Gp16 family protein [Aggregatibacter actinomycetemcomitans]MBN6077395.1 DUF1018 domain-containing protein [Aggregatibacter actinomycetemcomitans]
MKMWFSAKELAGIGGLSKYPSNINRLARKEKWQSRPLIGVKGGGLEYAFSSLPQGVQSDLQKRFSSEVTTKPKQLPAVKNLNLADLTAKQREIADARMALVAYVGELDQVQGRIKAIKHLCNAAKCGEISEELMALVEAANSKNGNNCGRVLSPRTLNQWVIDYHKCKTAEERLRALAPGQRQAQKLEELAWLPDFLMAYRNTNGVNVTEAYAIFKTQWHMHYADQPLMLSMLPSLDRVRRGLSKLPRHIKEIGRKTGASLRALKRFLLEIVDKHSCTVMTDAELMQVLRAMRAKGVVFSAKNTPKRPTPKADKAQYLAKITALLTQHGLPQAYTNGMAKKAFNVDFVHWLEVWQLKKVIQMLVVYNRRHDMKV